MSCQQQGINGGTQLFGIIGNPVHHTLSPVMHNACFAALGMNCVYVPLPTSGLAAGVAGLKALGFKGVSVTIPFKEEVVGFVDVLDPVAARIGAVNTLLIGSAENPADRTVFGSNTDWVGANRALAEKMQLRGSRVLLIGAGGAGRAIGFGLLEAGAEVLLTNRTREKGMELARQLGCAFVEPEALSDVRAVAMVNATSVGMAPALEQTPVPAELLSHFSVVMDIVYAPLATRLLREARAAGCEVLDGLSMLMYQGAAQFELWTGKVAPLEVMRKVLAERFGGEGGIATQLNRSS
ncbi:MAG TPA: shikimate dehydrogenase [Desulfobulbaceae bacterium]|nr:shikimate dehydrogenase [Desulfobulbaceae bacterium]